MMLSDCGESCYKEAIMRKDQCKWENPMQSKISSLMKNKTWNLVSLPHGKKTLPKIKVTGDDMPKFNTHLVAKDSSRKRV